MCSLWKVGDCVLCSGHCEGLAADDLEVAPDFFSYFSALERLLDRDPTIWCISAWNDNGKPDNVDLQSNGWCLLPGGTSPKFPWPSSGSQVVSL